VPPNQQFEQQKQVLLMPNYSANYDTPEEIRAMSAHWNRASSTPEPATKPVPDPAPVITQKADGLDRMRSEWNRTRDSAPKSQPTTDPIAGALKVLKSGSPISITVPQGFITSPLFPLGKTLITRGAVKQLSPSVIHRCFQRHASGDWGAVHPARAILNSTTDTGIHLSRYQIGGCFAVLLTLEKHGSTVLVIQAAQP